MKTESGSKTRTYILNVGFDICTKKEALNTIMGFTATTGCKSVYTSNPELVMEARKDKEFLNVLLRGDLVVPDGIGIVYASKLNRLKIKERVAGYDLVQEIFTFCQNKEISFYFLGGAPGVAEAAKKAMEEKYKGIRIIGARDGYFNQDGEREIIADIKEKKPDFLLVGLGFPKQEKWIDKHKALLPVKVMIGVGGSFDGMCGKVKRAPAVYRRLGLEWFYRLVKQPSRLKRQLRLPAFVLVVIRDKIWGQKGE